MGKTGLWPRSVYARLLGLAALGTALVVGVSAYLQRRIVERAVEREALDAATATAFGVATQLTERETPPSAADLEDLLADFIQAEPALRALTVTGLQGTTPVVEAATEAGPDAGVVLALAREAADLRGVAASPELPGALRLVAVPLGRPGRPDRVVVVTLSTEAIRRVRGEIRTTAILLAAVAVVTLTGLIGLLARRLVQQPLHAVRATMERAAAGELAARAPVARPDEIGALAAGLNAMLERLADFNAALQGEVQQATEALRERNRQLMESSQRLFAARRELARSEQLAVTGQMAASVAHQIGTPLNLISGYVQMILEGLPPDSVSAARLRTVREQIGKVATIVHGLLDQARRPALRRQPVPAADLARSVCELARPTLEAAGIALTTAIDSDLPAVDVDAGQIEQVFLNLITNSIDAMPGGGTLTVSARATETHLEFEVRDSGPGIPPADMGRVFDPLFTTKHPGKGTGLGLTIARDVLAAHGGSVSASNRPGGGAVMTVRLPRVAAPVESHA